MDPLCIDGQRIETVDSFEFLGNTISNDLSWKANTNAIVSKAHQRLYFLRQLRKFGLKEKLLTGFYRCTIESVFSFPICVWFGGLSAHQQRHLDRVVKTAERIIGCSLPPLGTIYIQRPLPCPCPEGHIRPSAPSLPPICTVIIWKAISLYKGQVDAVQSEHAAPSSGATQYSVVVPTVLDDHSSLMLTKYWRFLLVVVYSLSCVCYIVSCHKQHQTKFQ